MIKSMTKPQMGADGRRCASIQSALICVYLRFILLCGLCQAGYAQTQPAAEAAGIALPRQDTPAAVLFVRAEQAQSKLAIQQLKSEVDASIQTVLVVSGPQAGESTGSFDTDWPVIADADYALAGRLGVHVWPTLVVLDAKQKIVGHVGGVPSTFARDAGAYIAAAIGKIDNQALQQRLNSQQIVADSAKDKAARHVELARRMIDDGKLDSARQQLQQAIDLQPDDPSIRLLAARTAILAGEPGAALTLLDTIKPAALPVWQMSVTRLHALVALDRWDEARSLLPQALNLNPEPSQAHYLAGRILEHDGNPTDAAGEYRKAYECAVRTK